MARSPQYSTEGILEAATELAARSGPTKMTIAAIAASLGAPTGSIYHRFRSKDVLLAELWLQTVASFQGGFQAALGASEPMTAGLEAALYTPRWVRAHPVRSRLLLLHHREDFLTAGWPPEVKERADEVARKARVALHSFTRRALGSTGADAKRRVRYAVVELPVAAVIEHVRADEPPPPIIEELVADAYRGVLGGHVRRRRRGDRRRR